MRRGMIRLNEEGIGMDIKAIKLKKQKERKSC
jgi:hypothetical protein